jgi:hypothetical protein
MEVISVFGRRDCCRVVGWGILLRVGRSRVRFQILFFSIYLILPAALWPWGLLSLWQKWVPGIILASKALQTRKADFTAIWKPTVYEMWDPQRLTTLWVSTTCYRDSFTFTLLFTSIYSYSPHRNSVSRLCVWECFYFPLIFPLIIGLLAVL